eukprot:scaffold59009_cov45-Phaeocystis_antarctica.AAC.3
MPAPPPRRRRPTTAIARIGSPTYQPRRNLRWLSPPRCRRATGVARQSWPPCTWSGSGLWSGFGLGLRLGIGLGSGLGLGFDGIRSPRHSW